MTVHWYQSVMHRTAYLEQQCFTVLSCMGWYSNSDTFDYDDRWWLGLDGYTVATIYGTYL